MCGKDAISDAEQITIYNSNSDTMPHNHDFIEIVYFKEGIGVHSIDGENLDIHSGCICIINTGVSHSYKINNSQDDKSIVVKNCIFYSSFLGDEFRPNRFIQDFWNKVFKGNQRPPKKNFIQIDRDYNRDYETMFNMIEYEIRAKKVNYLDIIRNDLINILIRLFRDHLENVEKPEISSANGELMEKAIKYISEHYNSPLTVAACSKNIGFSTAYFNRLFKIYTKSTFRKYLQKLRCEKACILLRETDMSIQSISAEVGYNDPKQFYLLFKKFIGTTPNNYRGLTIGMKNTTPPPQNKR